MKELILDALARSRAGYSELRLRRTWSSSLLLRDRTIDGAQESVEQGGLARCCSPGTGWGAVGFDGSAHLETHLLRAHEMSMACSTRQTIRLASIPIRQHETGDPPPEDPRSIPLLAKRERIEQMAARLLEVDRRIQATRIMARDEVVETWLGNSEGTWIQDLRTRVSVTILVVARQEGAVERSLGSYVAPAWSALDPIGDILKETGSRAVTQLEAVPVRSGRYPVILDPAAAGALLHRAVVHAGRAALPGADPDVLPLGARIGPDLLTVGDDPTVPGLVGSSVYDDEGTETRRTMIVQNGIVLGHLHCRETAGASGAPPTGHARAATITGAPYPRATNSFLAPGTGTLDDLLQGVSKGLLLGDALGCEHSESGLVLRPASARMIRDGRLAEAVKGVRVEGELLDLLGRIDAVGADFRWETGAARCRDGAAGLVPVTTGAPHLRIAEAAIGCELT